MGCKIILMNGETVVETLYTIEPGYEIIRLLSGNLYQDICRLKPYCKSNIDEVTSIKIES